jgi:antitoxin (DNA-binding transcriptional repressor) of toxin-antitoxin stability system
MINKVSIQEFEDNFDNYLQRVENGETFIIKNNQGKSAVMIPADEEIVRIHTEHNDAC